MPMARRLPPPLRTVPGTTLGGSNHEERRRAVASEPPGSLGGSRAGPGWEGTARPGARPYAADRADRMARYPQFRRYPDDGAVAVVLTVAPTILALRRWLSARPVPPRIRFGR